MSPKLSIIVPVYNGEKYIRKCIDSILNQSFKDMEIIVINDGSTDTTEEILKTYLEKDKRIKLINNKNSGPAAARNKGIKAARGNYIGFVDSDDYIELTMYEKLYEAAEKSNVEVIMCGYRDINSFNNTSEIIKSNLEAYKVYYKEAIRTIIIRSFTEYKNYGYFSLCNKIYSKELLKNNNLYLDEKRNHGEDWWFNINVFLKLNSVVDIGEPLYNYVHINSQSLMCKYREDQFDLFLDGRYKVIDTIPKELINEEALNENFILEFSSYIIRTFKEVKDKKKRRSLIDKVLSNKEVILCAGNVKKVPLKFKVLAFFIKEKMRFTAFVLYKLISLVI